MGNDSGSISSSRKGLYTLGLVLTLLGVAVVIGGFVHMLSDDPASRMPSASEPDFERRSREWFDSSRSRGKTSLLVFVVGAGLAVGGQVVRRVAARGVAGSGLVLDPQRARKDLEPWSRMAGGMAEDALSEAGTVQRIAGREAAPTVQVRCRACKALNAEAAKFCDQCGQSLA